MSHVLLIGGAPARLRELQAAVIAGGYACTIAISADEALDLIEMEPFDMILLDADRLGPARARIDDLRIASNLPLILLSGRVDGATRIAALEDAPDQAESKSFRLPERHARMRARMRRYECRRRPSRNGHDNDPLTCFLDSYEGELITTDDLAGSKWSAMRKRNLPDLISAIRFRMKLQGQAFMILAERNHAYRLIRPHPGRASGHGLTRGALHLSS